MSQRPQHTNIWKQLGRRFGHTDAPRDAIRRFDSRRQMNAEFLKEFQQALRLLHREAWPEKIEAQRDSELKRRFDDGLLNAEIAQYLKPGFHYYATNARKTQAQTHATHASNARHARITKKQRTHRTLDALPPLSFVF